MHLIINVLLKYFGNITTIKVVKENDRKLVEFHIKKGVDKIFTDFA